MGPGRPAFLTPPRARRLSPSLEGCGCPGLPSPGQGLGRVGLTPFRRGPGPPLSRGLRHTDPPPVGTRLPGHFVPVLLPRAGRGGSGALALFPEHLAFRAAYRALPRAARSQTRPVVASGDEAPRWGGAVQTPVGSQPPRSWLQNPHGKLTSRLSFPAGSEVGRDLLRLPPGNRGHAAGYGGLGVRAGQAAQRNDGFGEAGG